MKIKPSKELPMKWYWFIIIVLWPLYLIGNWDIALSEGNLVLEGNIYVAIFRSLLMSVICYGLYKKFDWSSDLYLWFISLDALILVTASSGTSGPSILLLILSFLYIYPQWNYFSHRKHLFTNSSSLFKYNNRSGDFSSNKNSSDTLESDKKDVFENENKDLYPPNIKSVYDHIWKVETGMPLGDSPLFGEELWGHWEENEKETIKEILFVIALGLSVKALSNESKFEKEIITSFFNYCRKEKSNDTYYNEKHLINIHKSMLSVNFPGPWQANQMNVIRELIFKESLDLAFRIRSKQTDENVLFVNDYLNNSFFADKVSFYSSLPEIQEIIDSSFEVGMYKVTDYLTNNNDDVIDYKELDYNDSQGEILGTRTEGLSRNQILSLATLKMNIGALKSRIQKSEVKLNKLLGLLSDTDFISYYIDNNKDFLAENPFIFNFLSQGREVKDNKDLLLSTGIDIIAQILSFEDKSNEYFVYIRDELMKE